jgi:hypothetical protein
MVNSEISFAIVIRMVDKSYIAELITGWGLRWYSNSWNKKNPTISDEVIIIKKELVQYSPFMRFTNIIDEHHNK